MSEKFKFKEKKIKKKCVITFKKKLKDETWIKKLFYFKLDK
jgi:hypothetical protein